MRLTTPNPLPSLVHTVAPDGTEAVMPLSPRQLLELHLLTGYEGLLAIHREYGTLRRQGVCGWCAVRVALGRAGLAPAVVERLVAGEVVPVGELLESEVAA